MGKQPNPKELAPWLLLAAGAYLLLRWIPRVTPAPPVPGAESGSCGTGPFTIDDNQARSIADAIESVVFDMTEDEQEVARLLMQARTDGDVCRIVKAYGSRRLGLFLGPFTLPQVVSRYLNESVSWTDSTTWVQVINNDYARKGIRFRF